MKTLAALSALALIGACAAAGDSRPRYDWLCDGGKAFSVRYDPAGGAEIFAGGQIYRLPSGVSGSGARYTDGTVEYWEHQGEATLTGAFAGPYENCRQG